MFTTPLTTRMAAYNDMLDEVYPDQMMGLPASHILREVDPIAYRTGFHDWLDSEGVDSDNLEDDAELP